MPMGRLLFFAALALGFLGAAIAFGARPRASVPTGR